MKNLIKLFITEDKNEKPPSKVQIQQNIIPNLVRDKSANRCRFRNRPLQIPRKMAGRYLFSNFIYFSNLQPPWSYPILDTYGTNGIFDRK